MLTPADVSQSVTACATDVQPRRWHCRILTDFDQLETVAAEWQRLWSLDPRREIFQHFGWARAWVDAWRQSHSLYMPVVFEGERVAGILPLVMESRCLRFLGYSAADYNTVLCDPAEAGTVLNAALESLLQQPGEWQRMVLDNVPEQSQLGQALALLPERMRRHLRIVPYAPCPTLLLDEDKDRVLREMVAKDSLRRHSKKLAKLGEVTFRHLESAEEVRRHLPEFFRQHIRRLTMAGRHSHYRQFEPVRFCENLARELDLRSELRFSVVEVSGRPVAYHLGFQLDGKYIWYKPAFDVDLWACSPGEVLLSNLFQHLRGEPVREFDFTQGGEDFKYRFANHIRQNVRVHMERPGWRGALPRAAARLRSAAGRVLEARPKWKQFLTRILERWQRGGLLRDTIRTALFAWDEVLLFSGADSAGGHSTVPAMRTAGLSGLADIAAEHPAAFDRSALSAARDRLKGGAIPYLSGGGEEPFRLVWWSERSEAGPAELGVDVQVNLGEGAVLLYDCRSSDGMGGAAALGGMLRELASQAKAAGRPVWVACRAGDRTARAAAAQSGFRLARRITKVQLLRRFRWMRNGSSQ